MTTLVTLLHLPLWGSPLCRIARHSNRSPPALDFDGSGYPILTRDTTWLDDRELDGRRVYLWPVFHTRDGYSKSVSNGDAIFTRLGSPGYILYRSAFSRPNVREMEKVAKSSASAQLFLNLARGGVCMIGDLVRGRQSSC